MSTKPTCFTWASSKAASSQRPEPARLSDMYPKVLAVLLTSHFLLIPSTNLLPVSNSFRDKNRTFNSRAEPWSENSHASPSAVDIATETEGNHAEGRSSPRTAPRLRYPAAKISKYRSPTAHRPRYSQQFQRYPVHRAQERYQPSDVGNKRQRPNSQYQLQPPNLPSSFMQNTEIRPSKPPGLLESGSPIDMSPADPDMPQPNPGSSVQSDSPSGTEQKSPPKQPSADQTPPPTDLAEGPYSLSRPKYPYYHHSEGNPPYYNLQDDAYVDYDPNSQEHKPYTHDHLHYHHSVYYMPPPNSTHQPMETTPGPEENRNKKPYTYYYIGRKLWYIPMYFSAYFAAYITSLLVKSIARHKIRYPLGYWTSRSLGNGFNKRELELATEMITKALKTAEHRYR